MSFREFAKDYEIEYVDRPGHKRPKAVRIYVGPWYRFAHPEKIPALKRIYLIGIAVIALSLLVPMCIDCTFTRIWYIQVAAAIGWIPWVFAACATWRLWTAKEKVNREHNKLMVDRMSSACLGMAGFCTTSLAGCIYALATKAAQPVDYLICICCMFSSFVSIALFSRRKGLETVITES